MTGQEVSHKREYSVKRLLKHVMPGTGKGVDFGLRQAFPPLAEKIPIENEIALAPTEQGRDLLKAGQAAVRFQCHPIGRVSLANRDVLNETQGSQSRARVVARF